MTLTQEQIDSVFNKHGVKNTETSSNKIKPRRERLGGYTDPQDTLKDKVVNKQLADSEIGANAIADVGVGAAKGLGENLQNLGNMVLNPVKKLVEKATPKSSYDINLGLDESNYEATNTPQKAGKLAENIAEFIVPGAGMEKSVASLPKLSRILAKTAPDILLAFNQSKGDLGTTASTGITSAVANTILPGSGAVKKLPKLFSFETAKDVLRKMIPGYVGDVTTGLTGDRGEDRKGLNSLIPGYGTIVSGALATAPKISQRIKDNPEIKTQSVIENRKAEISKIMDKYPSVKEAIQKGKERGVDLLEMASKSSLLDGAVNESGRLIIKGDDGAIAKLNREIAPYEGEVSKALEREGKSIAFKELQDEVLNSVETSGLRGANLAKAREQAKKDLSVYLENADENGMIPLTEIHKDKVAKYATVNYENESSKIADKSIAKGLKTAVEKNSLDTDVQEMNKELSKIYSFQNFLETIDNKLVDGGKLGKYFNQIIGMGIGSKFGPFGAILGAEGADMLTKMSNRSKFGGTTGQDFEVPEVFKENKMKSDTGVGRKALPPRSTSNNSEVYSQNTINLGPKIVDEAQAPSSEAYSESLGNRKINQATISNNPSNPIRQSVLQMLGAVKKGLQDPVLKSLYDNEPLSFINEIKTFISSQGDNSPEVQVIQSLPETLDFDSFFNIVNKLLK